MLRETVDAIDQYRADALSDDDPYGFLCGVKSPRLPDELDVGRARIRCSRVPDHRGDHAFTSTENRSLLASWTHRDVPAGAVGLAFARPAVAPTAAALSPGAETDRVVAHA